MDASPRAERVFVPTPSGVGVLAKAADGSPIVVTTPPERAPARGRPRAFVTVTQYLPAPIRSSLARRQSLPKLDAATRPEQLFLLRGVPDGVRALVVARYTALLARLVLAEKPSARRATPPEAPTWNAFYDQRFSLWYDAEIRRNPRHFERRGIRVDRASLLREADAQYRRESDPDAVVYRLVEQYRACAGRYIFAETAGDIVALGAPAPNRPGCGAQPLATVVAELKARIGGERVDFLGAAARAPYLYGVVARILAEYLGRAVERPQQRLATIFSQRVERLKALPVAPAVRARYDAHNLEAVQRDYARIRAAAAQAAATHAPPGPPPPARAELEAAVKQCEQDFYAQHRLSLADYLTAALLPVLFLERSRLGATAKFFRAKLEAREFEVGALAGASLAHLWPEFAMNSGLSDAQFGEVLEYVQRELYHRAVALLGRFLAQAVPGWKGGGPGARRRRSAALQLSRYLVEPRRACRPGAPGAPPPSEIPLQDLVICYADGGFTCHSEAALRAEIEQHGLRTVNPQTGKPFPAEFVRRMRARYGLSSTPPP